MPTDPEHIDDVVGRLRSQHSDLRQGAYYRPSEDPTWDTTPAAADLITELADKLALWESVLTDLATQDFRGPEPADRAIARRALGIEG